MCGNTINIFNDKSNEYLLTTDYRDIKNIKSLHDLESITTYYDTKKSKNVEIKDLKEGAEKVFEDSDWLIIHVKTEEASCYYGANTKWCTSGKTGNMFGIYSRPGPIMIIIDKNANKKYQLRLTNMPDIKNELKDELDENLDFNTFKHIYYPINIAYKKYFNTNLSDNIIISYLQIYDKKINIELNIKTNKYDVYGDFYLKDDWIENGKSIIQFNKINGSFICNSEKLTSLEGIPNFVSKYFDCHGTNITSLNGAPKIVKKGFDCSNTNITSLEGAPQTVGDNFDCGDCTKLESLEGGPHTVGGDFNCSKCDSLKSLKGAPQKVRWNFHCYRCKNLKSLKGIPKYIPGNFNCSNSPIETLEYCPEKIGKNFICSNTNISSLEHAPKIIGQIFNFQNCKNLTNITELPHAKNFMADYKFKNSIVKLLSKRGAITIDNEDGSIWLKKYLVNKIKKGW